jgi:hypothetical protein
MTPIIPQKTLNFFSTLGISALIALLWLVPVLATRGRAAGTGAWGIFSLLALILTVAAPLAYGWYSRDETGAVLLGIVPFLLAVIVTQVFSGNNPAGIGYLGYAVAYIILLSLVGGVEGFFAAKRSPWALLVAGLLAVAWTAIFLSGIR